MGERLHSALLMHEAYDAAMDIARPDLQLKKKTMRRRLVWIGVAGAVVVALFFVVRFERLKHRREWVTIKHDSREVRALVDFPKGSDKAPVVVLAHEVYGLSAWAEGMADELADEGFIVVAPDLLSGHGVHGGGYGDFASDGDRVAAVSGLEFAGVMADLDAAVEFGKKLPEGDGKLGVVGFSWGGWRTFALATRRTDLTAVFVFYGTGPDGGPDTGPGDVNRITAPVYGFYAGNDSGVDVTVPATIEAMKAAGKFYEPVTYEGAEHGFMRLGVGGGDTLAANKVARDEAFARLVLLLRGMGRS
jgi:carboxymethylenebutenolidase